MRKGGIEIEKNKRRRTVCTSSLFDDDSGAEFLQRFPEFKWLLVLCAVCKKLKGSPKKALYLTAAPDMEYKTRTKQGG